jgi:phosphoribosylamine---glycine ligase
VKILLVGNGGREHALAWKIRRDDPSAELLCAPGNPGIAELGRCVSVKANEIERLAALASEASVDVTVVGPEAPLAAGIADVFRARGLSIFGPSAAAARIEASKRFAKQLMIDARIPTAQATWHSDPESAKRAVHYIGAPVVIKASGLAAGKGVIICGSTTEAEAAIDSMLLRNQFGEAGNEVLVEEFMEGEELSVFAITDGESFRAMLPVQDHKRLLEGDGGPNTGGMGAYAPVASANTEVLESVSSRIIGPALSALREHGSTFSGLLYAGVMLTDTGPKVVEFNCRFGDPETQALLPLISCSLIPFLEGASRPSGLSGAPEISFSGESAVTTVLAAPGYPETPRTGAPIDLPETDDRTMIFHAGTSRAPDGRLITAGGRVLAVTSVAATFEEAQRASSTAASQVRFPDAHFRKDIGWRELGRRGQVARN